MHICLHFENENFSFQTFKFNFCHFFNVFLFRSLQNYLDLPRKNISFNHVFISMNNFKETFWHFLSHNTGFWLVKHNVTLACDKFALPKLTTSTFQSFPNVNSEKWIRKFCKRPKNRIISGVTRHFSSRSTIQTIVWVMLRVIVDIAKW